MCWVGSLDNLPHLRVFTIANSRFWLFSGPSHALQELGVALHPALSQSFLLGSPVLVGSYTYEPILIYLSFVLGEPLFTVIVRRIGSMKVCS